MADLRIFSYLPNPRIFKATIAARLTEVDIEIRGAEPGQLAGWLWDFEARPLTDADKADSGLERTARKGFQGKLYKTDAFLDANPFGTVPVAFSPDGKTGIFESNSIMRAVARLGAGHFPLYGHGPYEAARVDAFLDTSLVFARDSQIYLLALMGDRLTQEIYAAAADAFDTFLNGIETALSPDGEFIVGDDVTLADICFASELALFWRERDREKTLTTAGYAVIFGKRAPRQFPRSIAHFERLREHSAFAPDLEPYLSNTD